MSFCWILLFCVSYTDYRYAGCRLLSAVTLHVTIPRITNAEYCMLHNIMFIVILPSVVKMKVVAPTKVQRKEAFTVATWRNKYDNDRNRLL